MNLANCKVIFFYDNNAVIFINSLPKIYKDVKNVVNYGRYELTVDIELNALRSKLKT